MCKVSFFHCSKCRSDDKFSKHIIDEPQYCATFEKTLKTWLKKKKMEELPPWRPTKIMANTGFELFDIPWSDGLCYLHGDLDPVDCGKIEWEEQASRKSCQFVWDSEMRMEIAQLNTKGLRERDSERERKARMKFQYL